MVVRSSAASPAQACSEVAIMNLRQAFCTEGVAGHLGRLEDFLAFIASRMSAEDYAEAESRLRAAVDPVHAARRHAEAAAASGEPTSADVWNGRAQRQLALAREASIVSEIQQ
jgi:hypothetical protein